MKVKFVSFIVLIAIVLNACKNKNVQPENGIWRATLKTESGVEIPFNFDLQDSAGKKVMYLINGDERLKTEEIVFQGDSLFVQMPFEAEIRAQLGAKLKGMWVKQLADKSVSMEFSAEPNIDERFFQTGEEEVGKVGGRWTVAFVSRKTNDTTLAVGEFKQDGSKLTGTFLTATGDYRFLEGAVSENKLFLSTFDGSNAYLFTGHLENDSTIIDGKFYSGFSSITDWAAKRDEKAMLPDAYSLTSLKPGYSRLDFNFPNLEKKQVSSADERFKNKVVVVQFLGSWCPNCMDETAYLAPFYDKYKVKGVEVVALAYERTSDFDRSLKNLLKLKNRLDVNYEILITGFTNKEVLKSMPSLNSFSAFPTTVVMDKKGKVRHILTGFNGPGTGIHYTKFKNDFEKTINALLAEK